MKCRVCRYWKGDVSQWNEDGKPKVVGPCWRDPIPVETASTYFCNSIEVDPEEAFHWLYTMSWQRKDIQELRQTVKEKEATIERLRVRIKNLKQRAASPKRD